MRDDTAAPGTEATVRFAAVGALDGLDPALLARITDRGVESSGDIGPAVSRIIERVRTHGDNALLEMGETFDRVRLESVEVPQSVVRSALDQLDPQVREALRAAADSIAAFHREQLPTSVRFEPAPGVRLSRIAQPIERVGVYAPGGRAAYPSSVLMGAVPARIAGVKEVVLCSPPGPEGWPHPSVLAACAIAGVDRVFAIGGAGAIAALAFGTQTVPRVARIVGPGNAWVAEAKRQLLGTIAIDCPAGPSEVLILADASADPVMLAAELVAQAEHDPDAACVLVATDPGLPDRVVPEIQRLVNGHARAAVVRQAFARRGALLYARREAALGFASAYAAEHLLVALEDPGGALPHLENAGTIFLGGSSSVTFGDYTTGANHVLPTGGMARSFSGLSILDFLRWTTIQEISAPAARRLAGPTAVLADAEGLTGHALAARLRAAPVAEPVNKTGDSGPIDSLPAAPAPRGRAAYSAISTYDPGRRPVDIDLSDNTNLFGVCPAVLAALSAQDHAELTRYPSVYADRLVEAAAERFGVAPTQITTGCGSDDVIDSTIRAFCEPGDAVAFPWPTFGIVPTFARMNATRPLAVEHAPDEPLDPQRLLAGTPRMLYLCRPNNPTGLSASAEEVLRLAERFDGIVVVDEAYADYADDDLLASSVDSANIVVLRTLSKAWGLAGLRVGFAVGPTAIIAEITKSRGPYKVSATAERAGVAALRSGGEWVERQIRRTRENRDRLVAELRAAGHDPLPSKANFVLVRLPDGAATATDCAARLRERGIGVRAFEALAGMGHCIRVTVGPWTLMEAFLDAFRVDASSREGDAR